MNPMHPTIPPNEGALAPLPILYSFRRCPYAMRARMALLVSGQRVALREVVLRDKPAALRAASPKATVPVLCLPDGAVIDESLDIMRWALNRRDPEAWLQPDPTATERLIARTDESFKHHLDRYKYANRYEEKGDVDHRGRATSHLRDLDALLARQATHGTSAVPTLFAGGISLADAAIAPFIRQFANTDRVYFDNLALPHLQAWLAAILGSNLFAGVMMKRPKWAPNDARYLFPPDAPGPADRSA